MAQGFYQTLVTLQAAGTALTAASRASLTTGSTQGRFTLPANAIKGPGDQLEFYAGGIISVAASATTNLFDIAYGASLGTALFSTGAIPLTATATTSVPWEMRITATATAVGTASSWIWHGTFLSFANILTALPATGPGPGGNMLPYSGTATGANNVVSASGFNTTVSNIMDLNVTPSAATGSITLQQFRMSLLTATGF